MIVTQSDVNEVLKSFANDEPSAGAEMAYTLEQIVKHGYAKRAGEARNAEPTLESLGAKVRRSDPCFVVYEFPNGSLATFHRKSGILGQTVRSATGQPPPAGLQSIILNERR